MKLAAAPSIAAIAAFFLPVLACAQEAGDEAMKVAKGLSDAYVAAFNKADVKALGPMYAPDAEYNSDDGDTISGREAVVAGLSKYFAENKGAQLDVQIESARFLTPDVLVEKGHATVAEETTRYTCTYVKKGNGWLISQLDETTLPPADAAAQALSELSWLVGTWKDNNAPGINVETRVSYALNNKFLRRSFTVTREGEDPVEGTEVIGYDPEAGEIRSWTFDSEGGFGGGTWRHEGNKWLITAAATAPDGTTSTAQHIVTTIDDNKFTWESINRQSDGEALPNIDKIEVKRTSAPEQSTGGAGR